MAEREQRKKNAPKKEAKPVVIPSKVFGVEDCMAPSGKQGGTPMVSRPGKMTIATFLCFSNGIKMKKPEVQDDLDPTKVPSDVLKAKLKAEIAGIDS